MLKRILPVKVPYLLRNDVKFRDLPGETKRKIVRFILFFNVLLILIIGFSLIKIHSLHTMQQDFLAVNMKEDIKKLDDYRKHYRYRVNASVTILSQSLIKIKDETMPIIFAVKFEYLESSFRNRNPEIQLNNGTITEKKREYRHVLNGLVEEQIIYRANIQTRYTSLVYPLDKQMIPLTLSLSDDDTDDYAYLNVISLTDQTLSQSLSKGRNYYEESVGVAQKVRQYSDSLNATTTSYFIDNLCYLIYKHKNIYSYLKTIQFIIFAMLVAIIALLINPQKGSAISGRISIIGSSIFYLSANIFQVNNQINSSSGITLMDIISVFAGLIIIICFLITAVAIKLNDEDGYHVSKIYDLILFKFLIFYTALFLILAYQL